MRGEWFSIKCFVGWLLLWLFKVFNSYLFYPVLYCGLFLNFWWFLSCNWSQVLFYNLWFVKWRNSRIRLLIDVLRHQINAFLQLRYWLLFWRITSLVQSFLNIERTLLWCLFDKNPFRSLIPIKLELRLHLQLEDIWSVGILAMLHHWRYYQIVQFRNLNFLWSDSRWEGVD